VTIANAIHLMPHGRLFATALTILRPGGGLAVIADGTPLWRQPSDWSQALRHALEQWLGTRLESRCGTDPQSRQHYQAALRAGGFTDIYEESLDYASDLDFDEVIGGLYSAMPSHMLPLPDRRAAFARYVRNAIGPGTRFAEPVHVAALIGRQPLLASELRGRSGWFVRESSCRWKNAWLPGPAELRRARND
jgi:hypothetical protein